MRHEILPGTNVTIAEDVLVNGAVAFSSGEEVTVEEVTLNLQMPEYKYVVTSSRLGKRFQLRHEDFRMSPEVHHHGMHHAAPPPPVTPMMTPMMPAPMPQAMAHDDYTLPAVTITEAYDLPEGSPAYQEFARSNRLINNIFGVVVCLIAIALMIWVSLIMGIALFIAGCGILGYMNR